ncbi:MAG: epoxide hydrolase family protein [Gemmatimonas sp.]
MLVPRFRVRVEQHVLDDLQSRLAQVRFARFTNSGGWNFGTSPEFLEELVSYWRTEFNWHQAEGRLNALKQYTARVGGHSIHFVHERGDGANVMPLLLLHGWPDSFYRFHKVIPPLSDPVSHGGNAVDSFDVVVPSLPGFGFTGRITFDTDVQPLRHSAQLLWQLMTETLGYQKFAVAGGDIGRSIAQLIAIEHPESVIAVHLTDLGSRVSTIDSSLLTKSERTYLALLHKTSVEDGAYQAVQNTKPRSLAVALNDSPAGLASWIVDRFHSWSDHNGNIYSVFTKDELLTNIMLYWMTETIASSMQVYFGETIASSFKRDDFVGVPVGLALFPKDIAGIPPRQLAERFMNVHRWTEMPHGGHFAAWEVPELFVNDVREFFREWRTPTLANVTDSKRETSTERAR